MILSWRIADAVQRFMALWINKQTHLSSVSAAKRETHSWPSPFSRPRKSAGDADLIKRACRGSLWGNVARELTRCELCEIGTERGGRPERVFDRVGEITGPDKFAWCTHAHTHTHTSLSSYWWLSLLMCFSFYLFFMITFAHSLMLLQRLHLLMP